MTGKSPNHSMFRLHARNGFGEFFLPSFFIF